MKAVDTIRDELAEAKRMQVPVIAKPVRSIKMALRYILPRRLTLRRNPAIYAWLWWNF